LQFRLANEVDKPSCDKLTQCEANRFGITANDFHQVFDEPLFLAEVCGHDKQHQLAGLSTIKRQNLLNQFDFH
jgi:hypothetical protein